MSAPLTPEKREAMRACDVVLRHEFSQRRPHTRRPDIIENVHAPENCDFCALLARVETLEEALRRIERAHATSDHLQAIAREALGGAG